MAYFHGYLPPTLMSLLWLLLILLVNWVFQDQEFNLCSYLLKDPEKLTQLVLVISVENKASFFSFFLNSRDLKQTKT